MFWLQRIIFIARQHTDARYWYNNLVCPSVCPWRSGIRWKRLNISSQFFSPYGSAIIVVLPASDIFTKFRRGHPLRGHKIQLSNGTSFNDIEWSLTPISSSRYYSTSKNSKMVQDRAIFTISDQQKIAYGLSNGAIFNDLERTLTLFSRSHHSLTLNISQTATEYSYGHSYYRRRIGNRTQAFEWHQYQWPWVISNPDFKVTILLNVK